MKKIDLNMTIGKSIMVYPRLVELYMKHHIDFCCGGQRSLKEVISSAGIEAEQLIKMIETTINMEENHPFEDAYLKMSKLELMDHIMTTHHEYLKSELPIISELVEKIQQVHGKNHQELTELKTTFDHLKNELDEHLIEEEEDLFPKLRLGQVDSILIEQLIKEHDGAGDALFKILEITDHFTLPSDACATYKLCFERLEKFIADMYMHVHKENNILFQE